MESPPLPDRHTGEQSFVIWLCAIGISLGCFEIPLAIVRAWWQIELFRALLARGTVADIARFFSSPISDAATFLLFIGCISLHRKTPSARPLLLAWAIARISLKAISVIAILSRNWRNQEITWALFFAGESFASLAFPLLVLLLTGSREAFEALVPRDNAGFEVRITGKNATSSTSQASEIWGIASANATSYVLGDILVQTISWVGLAIAMGSIVATLSQFAEPGLQLISYGMPNGPRGKLIAALLFTARWSYPILFAGSLQAILNERGESRILLLWTIVFLLVSTARFFTYDLLSVGWELTHSPGPLARRVALCLSTGSALIDRSAFPVLVAILMGGRWWQKRAGARALAARACISPHSS